MRPGEHERLTEREREYWWHVGRRHILRAVLDERLGDGGDNRILDVGCGAGGNLELLGQYGSVVGIDDAPASMAILRAATPRPPAIYGSAVNLPILSGTFDAIALLDVLEHIDDDTAVLRECHRVLRPGASLVISVPAYQWLWSGHDEALGHRRRYTKTGLTDLIARAGFRPRRVTYAVSFLFPLIAGYRVVERMSSRRQASSYVMVPRAVNALFVSVLWAEARLIRAGIVLPFGTSIVVAAVKPDRGHEPNG